MAEHGRRTCPTSSSAIRANQGACWYNRNMKRVFQYPLRALLVILLTVGLAVAFPSRVLAIALPDNPSSVNAVYVYQDLLEDGDRGVLIDYYIDYDVSGPPPTGEVATEAYMAVFIDQFGAQAKAVAPYTYINSGYGRGIIWIYFTPTEAITYDLDHAHQALFAVWLVGNPTLAWAGGTPPKTIASIDYWQTAGDANVLLALRVIYYADQLERAWGAPTDLVESTSLSARLTVEGEEYFESSMLNLRLMAPNAFATGTYNPITEPIDYTTAFGATVEDGVTGNVAVPGALVEGTQSVNIIGLGDIIFTLSKGTTGTVTDDVGSVDGSPVDLTEGTNTVDALGFGNVTVVVNLNNTATGFESDVTSIDPIPIPLPGATTGFDLTDVATAFGMSRWMFSGLVWLLATIVICAAMYGVNSQVGQPDYGNNSGGKVVMLVFDLCIIGGAVLGLLHVLVACLLFIGFGVLTGYVLFFRQANA